MSLFITYEDNTVSEHWVPFHDFPKSYGSNVKQINVDGDELDWIETNFSKNANSNIPFTSSFRKIVRWYGDHAKFIVGNLTQ